MDDGAASLRQALEYPGRPGQVASEMQRIQLRIGGDDEHQSRYSTAQGDATVRGGDGGADAGAASNSQAVLSALRSLQGKIRVLEVLWPVRGALAACLFE